MMGKGGRGRGVKKEENSDLKIVRKRTCRHAKLGVHSSCKQ